MRKHVTPADPAASIFDPERGDALPADGRTVTWSAHWAGQEKRGEVGVSEPRDEPEPERAPTVRRTSAEIKPPQP